MSSSPSSHHVLPIRTYLAVFGVLLVLTAITVAVAFQDLGPFNNVVALGIAATKATFVILIFMHARWSTRLTKMVIVSGFAWLAILIAFTLFDIGTRDWMPTIPGR
jgi:cytochrome c oxidase subunit 4